MKITVSKVLNIALVSFLLIAILFVNAQTGTSEDGYDPWVDYDRDGKIDYMDLYRFARAYGTTGDPRGFINAPAYDSGWFPLEAGHSITLHHNLNTAVVLVYMIGSVAEGIDIHQDHYGCDWWNYPAGGEYRMGASWRRLSENTIDVYRAPEDASWNFIRLMMWRILEPLPNPEP